MSTSLIGDLCPRGSFYIKFYPELQRHFGSRNVPLIVGRLEFWFSNPKFKNGFFKFLEPCQHYLYKNGDSWSEELGFSRILFNKAFDLIGIRYKSKAEFLEATDPFQGKLYASYYHRKTNKMFYVRNHSFVDDFFQTIFPKKTGQKKSDKRAGEGASNSLQKDIPPRVLLQPQTSALSEKNDLKNRSRNVTNDRSFIDNDTTKKTNILLERTQNLQKDPESKIAEDMIHTWKEETGDKTNISILSQKSPLNMVFRSHFNASFDEWRQYCRIIGSSRFLTGKITSFRAWISWAVKPESINRIRQGEFSVWDQTPPMLVKTEQDVEEAYKKRLDAQRYLEKNKEKIRQAVISIQRDRYSRVESYFDQLPDNMRATLQKAYAEKHFINSQDIVTKLFHRNGWTGIPKHMIVMDYKANNERGIFTLSEQEEIEIYVQKQSLMDVYTSMQKEGEI